MKNRKIDLIATVDFNGATISHVLLREPNAAEFMRHGEPYVHSRTAEGQIVSVEDGEAIAGYLASIIVEPAGLTLDRVGLADGMRLKDAVLGFFSDARLAGSPTAPTASSGSSDGSTPAASDKPA